MLGLERLRPARRRHDDRSQQLHLVSRASPSTTLAAALAIPAHLDRGQRHLGVPIERGACGSCAAPPLVALPSPQACSTSCPAPHALSRSLSLAYSHVLWTQALGVVVSGSYAYVAAHASDALVVVNISNPASPVIRGSVNSSSLLDGVCEARRADGVGRGACVRTLHDARVRGATAC